MKELFIVANWKSNQPPEGIDSWVSTVSQEKDFAAKEVIVCPDYTRLLLLKKLSKGASLHIGAQDISPYDEGPYTGAVNGKQIQNIAEYTLVGHSERRTHFGENDQICAKKVTMAKQYGIKTIFCVQDENTPVPGGVTLIAYEPPTAIGSGYPDTPENAQSIAASIKRKTGVKHVLYGGSVQPENVSSFTAMPDISGVLVGGASLDAKRFSSIIEHA